MLGPWIDNPTPSSTTSRRVSSIKLRRKSRSGLIVSSCDVSDICDSVHWFCNWKLSVDASNCHSTCPALAVTRHGSQTAQVLPLKYTLCLSSPQSRCRNLLRVIHLHWAAPMNRQLAERSSAEGSSSQLPSPQWMVVFLFLTTANTVNEASLKPRTGPTDQ